MTPTVDNNAPNTELATVQVSPDRRSPPIQIVDNGKVRIGGQGPLFRPSIADAGKVRLGGQGPIFR